VLLQGFCRGVSSVGVVNVPTGIGDVAAGFGDARATDIFRVRRIPGGVAMRRAPEPGPIRGDRGELFVLL
jgi:2-keto-3-deoxy-galactonokinase